MAETTKYLLSTDVKSVYPTAFRDATYDSMADNTTEYNVTNAVRRIGERNYVISYDESAAESSDIALKVSIYGYIFEITKNGVDTLKDTLKDAAGNNPLYLYIRVDTGDDDFKKAQLLPAGGSETTISSLDVEVKDAATSTSKYVFQGLAYTTSSSDIQNRPYLLLFNKNGDIPSTSYGILDTSKIIDRSDDEKTLKERFTTSKINADTLSVTGKATIKELGVSDKTTSETLEVTNASNLKGTLEVGGDTTLDKSLTVKGKTTLGSDDLSSAVLEVNGISNFKSKTTLTDNTASTINLNIDGASLYVDNKKGTDETLKSKFFVGTNGENSGIYLVSNDKVHVEGTTEILGNTTIKSNNNYEAGTPNATLTVDDTGYTISMSSYNKSLLLNKNGLAVGSKTTDSSGNDNYTYTDSDIYGNVYVCVNDKSRAVVLSQKSPAGAALALNVQGKSKFSDNLTALNDVYIGQNEEKNSEGTVTTAASGGYLKVQGKSGKIVATENITSEKSLDVRGKATIGELEVKNTTLLNKKLTVKDDTDIAGHLNAATGYIGNLSIADRTITSSAPSSSTPVELEFQINKGKKSNNQPVSVFLDEFKYDDNNIFSYEEDSSVTYNFRPYYYNTNTWWNIKAPYNSDSSKLTGKFILTATQNITSFELTIGKGFNINGTTGKVATNYNSGSITVTAYDKNDSKIGDSQTKTFTAIASGSDFPSNTQTVSFSSTSYIKKIVFEYKDNSDGSVGGYHFYNLKTTLIPNTTSVMTLNSSILTIKGDTNIAEGLTVSKNVSVTGQVEANSFNAKSDKRLKENIKEYVCNKSILDLPIYKYDFINGEKNQIGCIAQELQEICPEIVKENKEGYLSIQESKIVYLLLEEVKKLKKRVDELEGK